MLFPQLYGLLDRKIGLPCIIRLVEPNEVVNMICANRTQELRSRTKYIRITFFGNKEVDNHGSDRLLGLFEGLPPLSAPEGHN